MVREGDAADALYVVIEGRAEISGAREGGSALLAVLGPGDLFGEIALLRGDARRTATVTAAADLRLLRVPAGAFHALLRSHPGLEGSFRAAADRMLVQSFLKLATPFESLAPERVRRLAERVSTRTAAAGERIVAQGAPGDACYLLRRGRAEVVLETGAAGEGQRLATLEAGALFGEAALVTDQPRNASVRALEPCDLLVLARDDLLAAAEAASVRERLRDLLRWRDRPRRADGIEEHARATSDGAAIVVLKDPRRGAYYQLSPEGQFLWRHLDGRTTLRELAVLHLREFGRFDPQAALDAVGGLARAGFVSAPRLGGLEAGPAPSDRWLSRLAGLVDVRWTFRGLDPSVTRAHRYTAWLLSPPALAVQAAVALAGLAAFLWQAGAAGAALAAMAQLPVLLWAYAGVVASTAAHEWAHALLVKAYGREVKDAGFGLYYLSPTAFVDTSDMWLEPRGRRLLVNLAGLFANMAVGGAAALCAAWVTHPPAQAVLWLVALYNYFAVVTNLNPLLELDGYYALSDALDRPRLRQDSLGWLGRWWRTGRSWAAARQHRVELIYGLSALAYATGLAAATVAVYRRWILERMAGALPAWAAESLGFVLALAVVGVLLAGVVQDLRAGARA